MEDAVDGEGAHVIRQVEFVRHVRRIEDEVKGEGPFLRPVFALRADEFFGPEFQRVFFLAGRVRHGVGFGTEGVGPEETEVAETAAVREG